MIFHPAIIALLVGSALSCMMALYAAVKGLQIIRGWDIKSGSERQLVLERTTYLISTILTYLCGFQLLSLFLMVFTVEQLHTLFVGAMCAAGSLQANAYGYPALIMKMINFLLAGLWLILNYVDNQAYDYPLIKTKYAFLIFLTPLIILEAVLQSVYFFGLKPNIITSCCGSIFSADATGICAEIAALPALPTQIALLLSFGMTFAAGILYYRTKKGAYAFAFFSFLSFLLSIAGIISFLSVYIYELPTHHCPFCLLQKEYGYIGYPLYLLLFGGTIMGVAVGILTPFRQIESLAITLPALQRKLTIGALLVFFLFLLLAVYRLMSSGLVLAS